MEIAELSKIIVDNGIAIACVLYLIYFQHNTMTKMNETLNQVVSKLSNIDNRLDKIEEEVKK